MSEPVFDRRVRWAATLSILALALGLRVWNIDGGVPYAVGVDEPQLVDRALRMMRTGDFHPHFFDYPSLYIYVQLLVAIATFLVGAIVGHYPTLASFTGADFYPVARWVTALFGVATVALTLRIGERFDWRAGIVGALLLAVMPMHVRESHFVLTDVPMTFFVTLTLFAALRAAERPTVARFAAAGAAAGLAAATKYNGGLAIALPLVVLAVHGWRGHRVAPAVIALAGAATGTFLVAAPYTVLALPSFLQEFARLNAEYRGSPGGPAPWITYLKHLRINLGEPAAMAVVAGLGLALVRAIRGPDRLSIVLLLLFPVAYFDLLSGRSLVFGRYLLPLVPMLCLIAALSIVAAADAVLPRMGARHLRGALVAAAAAALLFVPVMHSVRFNRAMGMPSTRQAAYAWLVGAVPPGTSLAVEYGALNLTDGRYQLTVPRRIIDHSIEEYRRKGVRYLVTTSESWGAGDAYRAYFTHQAPVFMSAPSGRRSGPEVRIYDVAPRP